MNKNETLISNKQGLFDILEKLIPVGLLLIGHVTIFLHPSHYATIGIGSATVFLIYSLIIKRKILLHTLICMIVNNAIYFGPWYITVPPLPMLLASAISSIIVLQFCTYNEYFYWFKVGTISKLWWVLGLVTVLCSASALITWAYWTDNLGGGKEMIMLTQKFPYLFVILVLIPGFALLNAFAEEVIYRGIFQSALQKIFKANNPLPILFSSLAFASSHYLGGFPNGKIGYLMTFSYAIMLGIMRQKTNGIFLPYVVHVVADIVIGYLLFYFAGKS